MNTWLVVLIVVGVIALVIKRFRGEPMNARDTFGPPIILLAIGIYSLVKVNDLNGTDIVWVVLSSVVGFVFGAVRGTTITIYTRQGVLWQRYRPWTIIIWVVSLAVGTGISFLSIAMGAHEDARPVTLSIGISFFGEMLSLGVRALSTGKPFAPERQGGSGGSPLDRLRSRARRYASGHNGVTRPDAQQTAPAREVSNTDGNNLGRSPTLREGINWLANQARRRG